MNISSFSRFKLASLSSRYAVWALALFAMGCSDGPSTKPDESTLIGSYELSQESKSFLTQKKSYTKIETSFVTLNKDRTISIVNIPDCYVDGFGDGHGKFLSARGTWEVEKTDQGYGVTALIENGGTMAPGIYHGSSILLIGKSPPFKLRFGLGDPDQVEFIEYEKRVANSS